MRDFHLTGDEVRVFERHNRRGRRRRSVGLRVLLASAMVLSFVATSAAPGTAAAEGSSGSFTFSGEVVGSLKVPASLQPGNQPACTISPQAGTDVITWNNVTLKEGGKTEKIADLSLELDVSKFGGTYGMKANSSGGTEGGVYLTTNDPYQWMSQSGTITISAGGKSGSVDGVLSDGTHHPGRIALKGSWAGCSSL